MSSDPCDGLNRLAAGSLVVLPRYCQLKDNVDCSAFGFRFVPGKLADWIDD